MQYTFDQLGGKPVKLAKQQMKQLHFVYFKLILPFTCHFLLLLLLQHTSEVNIVLHDTFELITQSSGHVCVSITLQEKITT